MAYYTKRNKVAAKAARKRSAPDQRTLVKKLDLVFSKYIRLRDAMPSGVFRCIACGKIKPLPQADCGHFHSRTHMGTRFDEDNCNAECRYCNRFSADHLIGYREHLLSKIGDRRFAMLDIKAHEPKHFALFELKELIKYYNARVEMLRREKGIDL